MRNHAAYLDTSVFKLPGPVSNTSAIRALRLLKIWYDRWQSRRDLARLDARLLADIGQDRVSAVREAAKPFWEA